MSNKSSKSNTGNHKRVFKISVIEQTETTINESEPKVGKQKKLNQYSDNLYAQVEPNLVEVP